MKPTNLGVAWFIAGVTGYVYRASTESLDAVKEPGYFDRIAGFSQVGDQIYIVAQNGVGLFYVKTLKPHVEIKEL